MPRVLTSSDFEEFRARVCAAAIELFAEQGFDAFNMRKLAERLDVSAMTAYRYFHNKADILAAVRARELNRLADRLEAAAEAPEECVESFEGLCRTYVAFAREDFTRYRLMFDLAQVTRTEESISAERRVHEAFVSHARICGFSGADAMRLASLIWAALHGVVSLACMHILAPPELEVLLSETIRHLSGTPAKRRNGSPDGRAPVMEQFVVRGANTDGVIPLTAAE